MRKHTFRVITATVVATAGLGLAGQDAQAQLAEASASTLALSGAQTATVRGFGAISVNPAGLGMEGSGFSLAILPVQARTGFGPVKLSDLSEYEQTLVPDAVKEAWLTSIEAAGGQSALAGFDVSGFALTFGNFGLQLSTTGSADFNLPPGVAEAILFGNAGRTGEATDLDLTGLGADAFATTTAGASYAFPVGPAMFGVTGKYTMGHGLAVARATSGSISSDPIRITLESPAVGPCDDEALGSCTRSSGNNGGGFGADVGFMMNLPMVRIGASIINVFNTFAWDVETLAYLPGTTLVEEGTSESDFDEAPYANAPANLREIVDGYGFKPTIRAGAAMDFPMDLTVSADIHHRVSDEGLGLGPRSHLGVGAEWRALKLIHLRAGAGLISGGTQFSGGASLVLGPVNLSVAGALRDAEAGNQETLAQFTLSFGNR
ncbi:MAG: hypothetical protein WD995_05885 [Gemmatimonadota bacterium]